MRRSRVCFASLCSFALLLGCSGACVTPQTPSGEPADPPPVQSTELSETDVPAVHPLCERMGEDLVTKTSTVIAGLRFYQEHCPEQLILTALTGASRKLEVQKRYLEAGYLASLIGDNERAAAVYRKAFAGKTFTVFCRVVDGGDLSVVVKEDKTEAILNRWAVPMRAVIERAAVGVITLLGGTLVEENADYEFFVSVEIVHVADPDMEKSFYTEHEDLAMNRPPMSVEAIIVGRADPEKTLMSRANGGVRTSPAEASLIVSDTVFSLFMEVIQPTL